MDVPIAKSGTQHFGNLPEFFVSEREILLRKKWKIWKISEMRFAPDPRMKHPQMENGEARENFQNRGHFFLAQK